MADIFLLVALIVQSFINYKGWCGECNETHWLKTNGILWFAILFARIKYATSKEIIVYLCSLVAFTVAIDIAMALITLSLKIKTKVEKKDCNCKEKIIDTIK